MEYARSSYIDRLSSGIGSDLVKIVTGVRRCGKSYLLNTLFKRYLLNKGIAENHIIQLDFDGIRNKKFRDPERFLEFLDSKIIDNGRFFLLLDEVQLLEEFAEVLNDLIRMDNVDVYATGSNAHLLSKDVVTEFRGRGEEIAMQPLSFSEFMENYRGDKREGYLEYITYGGLPAVALIESKAGKVDYLKSIYQETYIRDILERNDIRNANDFSELVDVLCSNIGCLTNPSKIANTFNSVKRSKLTRATVETYIGYLEDSFLFEKAVRYDIKGRAYIGSDAKYYAVDMGLRNARMNFRQFEETHIMENIIYNELRGRGYSVDIGVVPSRRRDENGKRQRVNYEVDFVCNRGSQRCYIQSALALPTQKKIDQEQASFRRIDDSFKKVLVTKEGLLPHYNDDGILMLNIYDFLLDRAALEF